MSTGGSRSATTVAATAAFPVMILFVSALPIVLATANALGLTRDQTGSWILAVYGVPSVLAIVMSVRYRQPLLFTGNIVGLVFLTTLGAEYTFTELAGATALAGAVVFVAGATGLTGRLAAQIPPAIVWGLIAGAATPFVARGFADAGEAPAMAGGAFVAYLVSLRIFGTRVPPAFSAVVVGLAVAAVTGSFGPAPPLSPPSLEVISIDLSLDAILTVTPVFVVLMTLQANVPSVVFLRGQGYEPPASMIDAVSGLGAAGASFLGPTGLSLAFIAMPFVAGSDAGETRFRHRAASVVGAWGIMIAVLATTAAGLASMVPAALLHMLAALAILALLIGALQQIAGGPLVLGPIFTFAIAVSGVQLWNLGSFFWALVVGTAVSILLEREAWDAARAGAR